MQCKATFPEPETFNDTHDGRVSPRESDLSVENMHSHPLYRQWRGRVDLSMRQVHKAGEKLFVDYAGQKPTVVDRTTGESAPEIAEVQIAGPGFINFHLRESAFQALVAQIAAAGQEQCDQGDRTRRDEHDRDDGAQCRRRDDG